MPLLKKSKQSSLRERLHIFNKVKDAHTDASEPLFQSLYCSKDAENSDILRQQLDLTTITKQPVHAQFKLAVVLSTSATASTPSSVADAVADASEASFLFNNNCQRITARAIQV